jgi:hypothetical protein
MPVREPEGFSTGRGVLFPGTPTLSEGGYIMPEFIKPVRHLDRPSDDMKALMNVAASRYGGRTISSLEFYQELFPPDSIEAFEKPDKGAPRVPGHQGNPLVMIKRRKWIYPGDHLSWAPDAHTNDPEGAAVERTTHRILFNDFKMLKDWKQVDGAYHVFCSGLTYIGKRRTMSNAVALHALIFDLDYVTPETLGTFFSSLCYTDDLYPAPTHIVFSGSGVHLYYVFQQPIPLYHGSYGRKVKHQVNELKKGLTRLLWNPYTTTKGDREDVQYQGINQPFRMPGTYTKCIDEGEHYTRYTVQVMRFDRVKLYETLDGFYDFLPAKDFPEKDRYRGTAPEGFGLEWCKEHYPEWYERRIVQKDQSVRYWHHSPRMYEWWKRQVAERCTFGHRYNCLFLTVIYGIKCDIPKDQIREDLISMLPAMTELKPEDPITLEDVREAMRAYESHEFDLHMYPVKEIERLSGMDLKRGYHRRNGRPQAVHLRRIRTLVNADYPDGSWRNKDGRPKLDNVVREWRAAHPDGKKAQCIRDTGLAKHTVYKWWGA